MVKSSSAAAKDQPNGERVMELPQVVSRKQLRPAGTLTGQQKRALLYCSAKLFSHRLCHRPPRLRLIKITMFERPAESSLPRQGACLWAVTARSAFPDPMPRGKTMWDRVKAAIPPTPLA